MAWCGRDRSGSGYELVDCTSEYYNEALVSL
jgi:hypothetical protein